MMFGNRTMRLVEKVVVGDKISLTSESECFVVAGIEKLPAGMVRFKFENGWSFSIRLRDMVYVESNHGS